MASVSESEDGTDGIPDKDYFSGEGGTANDNYKDDGVIDDIEDDDILEESYGFVFKENGLKLNEDSVKIINSNGKYFITEDDLSMLANYYDNHLSSNTLLKKLSEHYGIPVKDLYVYSANNHILIEGKKAAVMSGKAVKNSIKKRIKAIDNQVAMKKKAKKTTKKLEAEKKKLKNLAK